VEEAAFREADVVVLGGGPAGSTCASALAAWGFSVILAERRLSGGDKLCGGCLSAKTLRLLSEEMGLSSGALASEGILEAAPGTFAFAYGLGDSFEERIDPPLHFIHRGRYDAFLRERSRRLGVVVTETTALHADPSSGTVRLAGGGFLRGRFLVGADGTHGPSGKALATVFPERSRRPSAFALQVIIPRPAWPEGPGHPCIFWNVPSGGYGWLFPGRTRLLAGLGGEGKPSSWSRYPALLRDLLRRVGAPPPEPGTFRGAFVPLAGERRKGSLQIPSGRERLLLVGDAAGFVHPVTGEGVFYAHLSGLCAARSIAAALAERANPLERYETSLAGMHDEFARTTRAKCWLHLPLGPLGKPLFRAAFRLGGASFVRAVHWGAPFIPEK